MEGGNEAGKAVSKLVFGVGWQDVGRGDWGSVASSGFFLGYCTVSLA